MPGFWFEKALGIGMPGIPPHNTTRMPGIWYVPCTLYTVHAQCMCQGGAIPGILLQNTSRVTGIWYEKAPDIYHTRHTTGPKVFSM